MIISEIVVGGCSPQTIVIGRRGTYDTLQVVFDLTYLIDTYGDGSAILMVKRKLDETAYPAETEQEDGKLLWTVSNIDTAYKGLGECEIFWYVDENLAKSVIFPLTILRDIGETTEEPPEPYETWVDSLLGLGAITQENARKAAQSEAKAEDNATLSESWAVGGTGKRSDEQTNNAKFWSDMAKESAGKDGWVHFYIDEDGHLHYVKTANAALTFYIDVAGHLHATNA